MSFRVWDANGNLQMTEEDFVLRLRAVLNLRDSTARSAGVCIPCPNARTGDKVILLPTVGGYSSSGGSWTGTWRNGQTPIAIAYDGYVCFSPSLPGYMSFYNMYYDLVFDVLVIVGGA